MNFNAYRRCSECNCFIIENPRVGARQVTCGAKECQRSLHKKACKLWHAKNREASRHHYRDVVLPFRRAQPTYQRRWRLEQRLREIREEFKRGLGSMGSQLHAVLKRARRLALEVVEPVQSGVITGKTLQSVMSAMWEALTALEQVGRCLNTPAVQGV
jgi:hypothetical protein